MSRHNVVTHPSFVNGQSEWSGRQSSQAGGERHGVVTRVAIQLGMGCETLRHWVKQAEVDGGQRPGTTTEDGRRIAELKREVRELRRANEILKSASAFFAAELDGRHPR